MRVQGAWIQAGLALGALGIAYLSWTAGPDRDAGDTVTVPGTSGRLEALEYQSDSANWVHLLRDGQAVWIELPTGVPGSTQIATRKLLGNERAQQVLARFSPLQALRSLGKRDDAKLGELGLTQSLRGLRLKVDGKWLEMAVSSPSSSGAPYLRTSSDGKVYLASPSLFTELQSPTWLVDRALHAFNPADADLISVRLDSRKWEGSPSSLEVASHLAPVDVYGQGEAPPSGVPSVQLRIDYKRGGSTLGYLEIGKGPRGDFLARTEHTAGWVKLSAAAEDVIKGAEKLIAGGR